MDVVGTRRALGQQQIGSRAAEQLARLTHRAERHGRRTGELDVVVAHDRQLTWNVDAHHRHLLEQPERDQVVGTERRRGATCSRQSAESFAGAPAFGHVEGRRLDHRQRFGRTPEGRQRPARPLEAIGNLHGLHRTTDERDALMALLAQMGDGEFATFHVVDADAAPRRVGTAVDEDDRHAAARMDGELRRLLGDGGDQDAAHTLFEEEIEVVRFTCWISVAVADVQRHAGRAGDLFDALGHVGEEGVRRIEHDVGDGAAVSRPQLPPGLVADEAELLDRSQHLAARRFADHVGAVQDVGHGAHRDSGMGRDLLDASGAFPHRDVS